MINDEFLEKYRVLEELLSERYAGETRSHSSVIMEFAKSREGEMFRDRIDLCREIRNLLTHNAVESGQPVVEPSEGVLRALESVIAYVEKPRLALDCGTPAERILCAHLNDRIEDIMHRMRKQGFSNTPVMEGDQIIGVFSVGALFMFLDEKGLTALDRDARIGDLGDAIDIAHSGRANYRFMPETTTVTDARAAFQRYRERNDRLRAIFITPTGSPTERLLALLTPWDVMKDEPQGGR